MSMLEMPKGFHVDVGRSGGRVGFERGWFLVTALATSVIHLVLHALGYALVLRHVYRAYPAGTPEFEQQLVRPPGELVIWAMALTSLSMGLFITTMMRWSGALTITQGLKRGVVLGLLYWVSINSGIYASSNHFSLPSVLVDTPMSALCMTLASAFAVWMLHARRKKASDDTVGRPRRQ